MTVTVFSTKSCGRCRFVRAHLESRGIEYQEVLLEDNIEQAIALRKMGHNLAPVVRVEVEGQEPRFSEGYDREFLDGLVEAKAS